jgi:hypothetical protein
MCDAIAPHACTPAQALLAHKISQPLKRYTICQTQVLKCIGNFKVGATARRGGGGQPQVELHFRLLLACNSVSFHTGELRRNLRSQHRRNCVSDDLYLFAPGPIGWQRGRFVRCRLPNNPALPASWAEEEALLEFNPTSIDPCCCEHVWLRNRPPAPLQHLLHSSTACRRS